MRLRKWFIISCSNRARRRSNIAGDRRKSSVWRTNERSRELAEEIGMPQPPLYTWIQKGRLSYRNVGSGSKRAVLVRADSDTIAALKAIRATPPPWRRLPPRPADSAAAPARSFESRQAWFISTRHSCL